MRGHAAADSNREMVLAWKRPDVAFKLRKKLDGDGVGVLRHEIALRHLEFVALERAASRNELIARARRQNKEVGFTPFAFDAEARFGAVDVHAQYAGPLHVAAGLLGALEQQAVQHLARINHDGMRHFEGGVMLLAADELNGMN